MKINKVKFEKMEKEQAKKNSITNTNTIPTKNTTTTNTSTNNNNKKLVSNTTTTKNTSKPITKPITNTNTNTKTITTTTTNSTNNNKTSFKAKPFEHTFSKDSDLLYTDIEKSKSAINEMINSYADLENSK